MASRIQLTIACDEFDIVRPLIDGTVKADGLDLVFVTQLTVPERHAGMLKDRAFDVCEFNSSTYFIARDQGVALTAIPVFLFRKFRHGFIFVNAKAGIREPKDLIGRRVGGISFQPAASVWARGILDDDYGVPADEMITVVQRAEDVPFEPTKGIRIEPAPPGKVIEDMVLTGELPALMSPRVPDALLNGDERIVRLFPNYKDLEVAYFRRTGLFPIMHVTAIRPELVDKYPWIPGSLTKAFEQAKRLAYARFADTRLVPQAWYGTGWEEESKLFGPDPWAYGLGPANRKNLETGIRYCHRQGMIRRPIPLEELFVTTEGI